jgi:hypothetical protein
MIEKKEAQARPTVDEEIPEVTNGTYEKPAVVYKGKLETYAIVCTQKTVGCNGGTAST